MQHALNEIHDRVLIGKSLDASLDRADQLSLPANLFQATLDARLIGEPDPLHPPRSIQMLLGGETTDLGRFISNADMFVPRQRAVIAAVGRFGRKEQRQSRPGRKDRTGDAKLHC